MRVNGLSSCDDAVERLAAVLSGVLSTGSSGLSDREAHRQARRGATAILPAVQAMRRIQDRLWDCRGETAWEGLVHRRCRMSPSSTGGAAAPRPAAAEGVSIRQVERAGWELIQATVEAPVEGQYWRVTHELARRTSPPGPGAGENG